MNKFKPNTEVIKKIGEEISKSAELFGWQFRDLSLQENMLLNKEKNKFLISKLKVSEEEFQKIQRVLSTADKIDKFYLRQIPVEHMFIDEAALFINHNIDLNVPKKEAYIRILNMDEATIKDLRNRLNQANNKWYDYELELKNNYKGSLAAQLGVEEETTFNSSNEFKDVFDKIAKILEEPANKFKNNESLNESIKKYGDYLKEQDFENKEKNKTR